MEFAGVWMDAMATRLREPVRDLPKLKLQDHL